MKPETEDVTGTNGPEQGARTYSPTRGNGAAWRSCLFVVVLAVMVGCSSPSKADVLSRTKGIESAEELRKTIGAPDDVEALAMFERWRYECSDGDVVFHVAGDKVILRNTEAGEE